MAYRGKVELTMEVTRKNVYFYAYTTTAAGEKHLHEVCTLTGNTCLRENHDCSVCERGDIARKWQAKYGKPLLPDPAKSSK
jgi:hypothetical protein